MHAHCINLLPSLKNMDLSYRFCLPPFFLVSFRSRTLQLCKIDKFLPCVWSDIELKFVLSFTVRLVFFPYVKPQHILQFHNKTTTTTTKHSCTLLVALHSLSFFSFYKSLQFSFEISATYREICKLSASRYLNWLICSQLLAQCISFPRAMSNCGPCDGHQDGLFVDFFFRTMYNATIIRFGFCDIRYS